MLCQLPASFSQFIPILCQHKLTGLFIFRIFNKLVIPHDINWNEARQFSNFYNHILLPGKARDLWLDAIKKGNGDDQPIDPEAPGAGDFEQVVANFFGEVRLLTWAFTQS